MAKPGHPRFRPGNKQPDGSFPPIPPKTSLRTAPMLESELAGRSAAEGLPDIANEALATVASIMRSPGRNSQAQLAAAKLVLERAVPLAPIKIEVDDISARLTAGRARAAALAKVIPTEQPE